MSFHNVRLPVDVEKGASGSGGGFNTNIFLLSSGFEQRNINWQRSRGRWDISYGMDTRDNHEAVLAFFYARRGRAYGFRFKDWTDYRVGTSVNPQYIGTGDGSIKQFQVFRRYTDSGATYDRVLTRLVDGTVRAFVDGTEAVITTDFTVNANTGVITFVVAPADGLDVTVICEFDVPVRFDIDQLDLVAERDDAFSFPAIPIVEIREELEEINA